MTRINGAKWMKSIKVGALYLGNGTMECMFSFFLSLSLYEMTIWTVDVWNCKRNPLVNTKSRSNFCRYFRFDFFFLFENRKTQTAHFMPHLINCLLMFSIKLYCAAYLSTFWLLYEVKGLSILQKSNNNLFRFVCFVTPKSAMLLEN